jgi:hypothetical protein
MHKHKDFQRLQSWRLEMALQKGHAHLQGHYKKHA